MIETILSRAPTEKTMEAGDASVRKSNFPDKTRCKIRFKQLFEKRREYEARWKSIRDYQLPYLGIFDDTADSYSPARRRDDKVHNGIAWEAAQIFAAGVMSGLTPPSRQWFKFSFADRDLAQSSEAAAAMDERQEILTSVLAKSNFYNAVHSVYTELPFGQCPLGIFPSSKTGVHFMPFTIGSYALDVGSGGQVNTFARKYKLTAIQLKEQFGYDNLPRVVKDALEGNAKYSAKFTVCWLVEPNENMQEDKKDRLNMEYWSLYWLEEAQEDGWLYVGGFNEWAIPTARYLITGMEPYAKGPGWFAEGDAKMLQVLEKDFLTAVELGVKPPMQGRADSVMKGINLIPGGATIVEDLNSPVRELFQVRVDLNHLQMKIKEVKDSIRRAYSADLFMMLDQLDRGQMTAREVMERSQEKLQQLGPVTERLQFEFLTPIIERVYYILDRAGVFPDFPEELVEMLDGREIKIDYISPLAQAQKMSGLVSIEQSIAFVGQLVQLWPEVVDKIDAVETVNRYLEMLGAPATIRRSDDEVSEMVKERQQQMQQQQQAQQMMQAAPALNQAAQAAKSLNAVMKDGNVDFK